MLSANSIKVMKALRKGNEITKADLWEKFGDMSMVDAQLRYLEEVHYIFRVTLDFPGCPIEVIRLSPEGEAALENARAANQDKTINRWVAITAIIISVVALWISWLTYLSQTA